MIYSKKIRPEHFQAIIDGDKPFEVRKEDDVVFRVGDILALNELGDLGYTGRSCVVEISYVLRDPQFVREGYAILGVRPCSVDRFTNPFTRDAYLAYRVPVCDIPVIPSAPTAIQDPTAEYMVGAHSCRAEATPDGYCTVCGAIVPGTAADYSEHGYDPPDTC